MAADDLPFPPLDDWPWRWIGFLLAATLVAVLVASCPSCG